MGGARIGEGRGVYRVLVGKPGEETIGETQTQMGG